jgi:uncharacterized protein YfiM (DUF2279 family)
MRGFALVFSLHLGPQATPGDRWFSADKAQHFFTAAFVESLSFSAFRVTKLSRSRSLGAAAVTAGVVSVGKELYDWKYGGDPSLKDLTWDGAGMLTAGTLLRRTER